MIPSSKRTIAAILLISTGLTPVISSATNGYFLIGFGAKSRGMGGVGVAEGVDGLAAAYNPATMADVGTRFDIGFDIFYAPNVVTHSDGTLSETTILEQSDPGNTGYSYNGLFLIPNMGGTYQYNDRMTFGFAFIGAGATTEFNQSLPPGNTSYFYNFNGKGGDNRVGVSLLQAQIPLSIAYKLNEQHTVGASVVMAAQLFSARGLKAFTELNLATSTENISNTGNDLSYGAGFRLGWQGKFIDDTVLIGINYSSRVYMTEFDKYSSLFAEHGDFDIPENYSIGITYNGITDWKMKFDVQKINYSDIASVGNPGPYTGDTVEFNPLCPGPDPDSCKLGGDQGMGFGWSDQTVYKLGIEYAYSEKLDLRSGINYAEAPMGPEDVLFNMLAPATTELHLTLGATYHWRKDIEISGSYVHAFENTIEGQTLFQPLGSNPDITTTNAAISMKQRSLGVSLGIKW